MEDQTIWDNAVIRTAVWIVILILGFTAVLVVV